MRACECIICDNRPLSLCHEPPNDRLGFNAQSWGFSFSSSISSYPHLDSISSHTARTSRSLKKRIETFCILLSLEFIYDFSLLLNQLFQSLDGKFIARELIYQLSQFACSHSHVVVDLLVAYGVFLAEGKGG